MNNVHVLKRYPLSFLLEWRMIRFLNLIDTIDMSRVNPMFNNMVRRRINLRSSEILRLRRILRSWKRYKRFNNSCNNSWKRSKYHPNERVIF